MPADQKITSTTPQVEVRSKFNEIHPNKNRDTQTASTIGEYAKTSVDTTKHAPDAQDTAFRIQHEKPITHIDDRKESSSPTPSDNELSKNPIKTTIRFASGLSLPISSHTAAHKTIVSKSGAKPKLVTNDINLRPSSSSHMQKPVAVVHKQAVGDDVHDQLHFSALGSTHSTLPQSLVTEGEDADDDTDQKKKKKYTQDKIIESKKTAARAMMAHCSVIMDTDIMSSNNGLSTPNGFSYTLLKHLIIKLESASTNANEIDVDDVGQSVALTFNPESSWMNYEMGVQFLQDVHTVLEHELIKAKESLSLHSEYKIQVLNQDVDCLLPEWLRNLLQSVNAEVFSLVSLLSQVEYAVLKSYDIMSGQSLTYDRIQSPVMSINMEHELQQKMFTPPTTPLVKSSRISVDGSMDLFHTPREVDSLEGAVSYKITPERMQHSSSRDISSILSTANVATLHLRELLRTTQLKVMSQNTTNMKSRNLNHLTVADLNVVQSAKTLSNVTEIKLQEAVTDIWNKIIGSARNLIILSIRSSSKDNVDLNADDDEVLELFGDDGFDSNAVKKKKKKKNNKKKKKKHLVVNCDSVHVFQHDLVSEEIINIRSDSTVTSEHADSVSFSGVVTLSNTDESKTKLFVHKEVKATVSHSFPNLPTVPTNGISNGNKETTDHELKDIQNENDGWETVEHKASNRLKRISANAKAAEKLTTSNQNLQASTSNARRKSRNKRRNKNKEIAKTGDVGKVVEVKKLATSNKGDGELKKKFLPVHLTDVATNGPQNVASTTKQQNLPMKDVLMSSITKMQSGNGVNGANLNPLTSSKLAVTDQNTASTGPETVSAASKTQLVKGMATESPIRAGKSLNEFAVEASVMETKDNSTNSSTTDETSTRRVTITTKNSVPPFSTLVGPSNVNSADSSVASSLEAPHATRHGVHHHHQKHPTEDDVGYHLLKVCEKLSSDMDVFMRRRSAALTARRRERCDLLASLQEIVQSIWPGRCKVEMYGSCATRLDLPSSDLDVVVCGLDRHNANPSHRENESVKHMSSPRFDQPSSIGNYHHPHFIPLSANGNRVMRLAAELEKIPWAVQVKPIPTASVPVIKILADPSRLPGSGQIDWMLQQRHLSSNSNGAMSVDPRPQCTVNKNNQATVQHIGTQQNIRPSSNALPGFLPTNSSYPSSSPPWRGADVMNGLLSLDITFEGPEHGGLGSTAFSARVIQEACNESGLPPESTPAVKVLMVIKELLAQRRLNEPFSGGLSSYAILLLLVAVIKERRIIRKEIERVERQQLAVASLSVAEASDDVNSTIETSKRTKSSIASESQSISKTTSWAAIAMRSSDSVAADNESASNHGPKDANSQYSMDIEHSGTYDDADESIQGTTLFPQGSNDVLEVLCSGEPTAGKLLMHFLLFYGRHFDASTTCIDVTGTHHPDYKKARNKLQSILHLSPYINRKPGGTYNPTTDVYTVDPIIIYDPLKGSESNNVSRTCFAWENIRWTFEQCYNTLSGVVELGAGSRNNRNQGKAWPVHGNDRIPDSDDLSVRPLLELLLSF